MDPGRPRVAIVDYGLGNLFSVGRACEMAGLHAEITASAEKITGADGVILPGVGAFGDAMATLRRLDLVGVLQDLAASSTPLMGICLGVQLLMTESQEFGRHQGLGVIAGQVVRLPRPTDRGRTLKVPQVGWNRIAPAGRPWDGTPLGNTAPGSYMYFVHSYVVQPEDPGVALSVTRYGDVEFCSSLASRNIFACQFHPERSGAAGLAVYSTWAAHVRRALTREVA
jgi:glutamine amidotransferase